jgi:biopolymer transport protein TolR
MRPRKTINQMNVVPYIDVMLVLLVIFMITAPLISPGQVELPTMGSQLKVPVQPLEVTVRIERNRPSYFLRDMATTAPAVRLLENDLVDRIRQAQASRPDQPVVIAADRDARYQQVLDVLDLLRRNGVTRVGLLARSQS